MGRKKAKSFRSVLQKVTRTALAFSRHNIFDHISSHVGQAEIATLESERQFQMIQAQLMQDRRLQIVHMAFVFDNGQVPIRPSGRRSNRVGIRRRPPTSSRRRCDGRDRLYLAPRPSASGRTRRPR